MGKQGKRFYVEERTYRKAQKHEESYWTVAIVGLMYKCMNV